MSIEQKKIRARINIGSLTVETPYILSFNVNKSRGQLSTFSASLKVKGDDITGNISGNGVTISAGVNSPSNKIFTGIVKKATINPCFDDPNYVLLNLSGSDPLMFLEGKKYTRRSVSHKHSFVLITSAREGLRSGRFNYKPSEAILKTTSGNDPSKMGEVTSSKSGAVLDSTPSPGQNLTQNKPNQINVTAQIDSGENTT